MFDIPLSEPFLNGNEWKYVKECLDTKWVSSAGSFVKLFEEKISDYTGSTYAIACVNGTSALQVSLRLAGVSSGDEVILPTLTFIAPINAVSYNGGIPIFMDCDEFYNIDPDKTINFIINETELKSDEKGFPVSINKHTGNRIAAIVPVHIWGNAAKLDDLVLFCKERNISIVEDASESLGSLYKEGPYSNKHTGSIGQLGCLSFNGNKIITTGGGGMILTNDENLANKARYLTTQAKDDPYHYIHNEIGYNFRLTNIQAALGVAQLEQLPKFLDAKKDIHCAYLEATESIEGLSIGRLPSYANNNHWLNLIQIDFTKYGEDLETIIKRLEGNSIQARPVWALNHLQKPYNKCQSYKIDKAENLVKKSLCVPSSSSLQSSDIEKVVNCLNKK